MEKDRLIHDFLDGTLSQNQETELFYSLSSDEMMRMELKEQLAIKNAIKGDVKAGTPKVASTMAIFSELGLTPPPVAQVPAGGAAVTSSMSKIWPAISKYSGMIWTGVATAVTTAVVMLLLMEPGNFTSDQAVTSNNKPEGMTTNTNTIVNSNIPVVNSTENENASTGSKQSAGHSNEKIVYKYIYITNENPSEQTVTGLENIVKEIHQSDIAGSNHFDLSGNNELLVYPIDFELYTGSNILSTYSPIGYQSEQTSYGIVFEFRTAKDWANSQGLNPSQYQDWNNTSLSLFKSVSEELMLGVEYRRENFYLDFKGLEGSNQLYKYEVYPNTSSLTAAVRYSPEFLKLYNFAPFAQLSVGANNVGPVGRFFVGANYSPHPSYSLIFGIDGSAMRYNFQNIDYTSHKFGIQFGASFHL